MEKKELKSPWLTIKETVEYLKIGESTLYFNMANGLIPYYKRGGKVLFKISDLNALMEQCRRGANFKLRELVKKYKNDIEIPVFCDRLGFTQEAVDYIVEIVEEEENRKLGFKFTPADLKRTYLEIYPEQSAIADDPPVNIYKMPKLTITALKLRY